MAMPKRHLERPDSPVGPNKVRFTRCGLQGQDGGPGGYRSFLGVFVTVTTDERSANCMACVRSARKA